MFLHKVCSSLDRVQTDNFAALPCREVFSALRNEPFSFQIAYQLQDVPDGKLAFYTQIETDLPIRIYSVGYVPVIHTAVPGIDDPPAPGLFGDLLFEKQLNPPLETCSYPWFSMHIEKGEEHLLYAYSDSCQALWFTVNPTEKRLRAGCHSIRVRFYSRNTQELLAESVIRLHLADALLPRQTFLYTNWFYCDCLCDFYGVDPFSARFYEIFKGFVRTAAENGMNMLLLPAFTPPLDTPLEKTRRKIQLVKITLDNGSYSFDFSEMERYIKISLQCGMTHFEHAHLFSQWVAAAAPDIYATVNGKEKHLFGRKTKASGPAYKKFLRAYLPQLRAFLRSLKLEKKVLFHISDEPTESTADSYAAAKEAVGDLLDGCMCGDALSHYELYQKGLVELPIVSTDALPDFIGKCDTMWCYYTGGQLQNGLSNRLLPLEPARNRILGAEMYRHRIAGFLHWGYNYYYDVLSQGLFDPALNPCGCSGTPGTSFFVYPSRDGRAIPSVRQKVFAEGLLDYRALQCYEKTFGRNEADALLQACFKGMDFCTAASADQILHFRSLLNQALALHTPYSAS